MRHLTEDTSDIFELLHPGISFRCAICGELGQHICKPVFFDMMDAEETLLDAAYNVYQRLSYEGILSLNVENIRWNVESQQEDEGIERELRQLRRSGRGRKAKKGRVQGTGAKDNKDGRRSKRGEAKSGDPADRDCSCEGYCTSCSCSGS